MALVEKRKYYFLKLNSLIAFFAYKKPVMFEEMPEKKEIHFWLILIHYKSKRPLIIVVLKIFISFTC